jgi:adenosylcobinamide-GDP ribazoletransferase
MLYLKYQWQLFLLALGFFTRIPVGANLPYSLERMNHCGRYFPLVGAFIALICVVCFALFTIIFPANISLFFMMVISVLVTGAFHEDGLADMADGIGGGMTAEKRLSIMKDSRIGTYGAVSLILALLGKYLLLMSVIELGTLSFSLILAIGYISSRALAASIIFNTPYVSDLEKSKSKPLAQQQSRGELFTILAIGIMPLLLLPFTSALLIIAVLVVCRLLFKQWLLKRIGGFTGDCLGALQQISELMIYASIVAICNSQLV